MKKLTLPALAVLALTSIPAGAATVMDKIHDITVSSTQDYVFTETGVGSITLRAVFTPLLNGAPAAAAFTSLDAGVHVGSTAFTEVGGGNHFTVNGANAEGFSVTVSLLNATAGVDVSTIQFSLDSLGLRVLGVNLPVGYSWSSSATATSITTGVVASETLRTMDSSSYAGIATTPYTGTWNLVLDGSGPEYIQLSDGVAGANGLRMSATFIPEPSLNLLGGLGVLLLLRRRRI